MKGYSCDIKVRCIPEQPEPCEAYEQWYQENCMAQVEEPQPPYIPEDTFGPVTWIFWGLGVVLFIAGLCFIIKGKNEQDRMAH